MDAWTRVIARLRRHIANAGSQSRKAHAKSITAQTTETLVPAISLDSVRSDMKEWARTADVDVQPVGAVWWYQSTLESALAQVREGKGYVGLQFHGGGYSLGSAMDVKSGQSRIPRGFVERDICACLLSVDYSLVSHGEEENEHPFPLQILEALAAFRHLQQSYNIPPDRIILIGDSAGAHLVLALQRYLLQGDSGDEPSPGGLILLSPWCDLSVEAHRPHVRQLLGPLPQEQLSAPYFSPSLHPAPSKWPPTLIYYGALESFKPSITALASRLAESGAKVKTYAAKEILERYSHDFLIFLSVERAWPAQVQQCWTRTNKWVKSLDSM